MIGTVEKLQPRIRLAKSSGKDLQEISNFTVVLNYIWITEERTMLLGRCFSHCRNILRLREERDELCCFSETLREEIFEITEINDA